MSSGVDEIEEQNDDDNGQVTMLMSKKSSSNDIEDYKNIIRMLSVPKYPFSMQAVDLLLIRKFLV